MTRNIFFIKFFFFKKFGLEMNRNNFFIKIFFSKKSDFFFKCLKFNVFFCAHIFVTVITYNSTLQTINWFYNIIFTQLMVSTC